MEGATASIVNNTIVSNGWDGIGCWNGSGVVIKNNIVAGNGKSGISCGDMPEPEISYDNVWDNAGGNYSGCSFGTGDISLQPMFTSPENGNYYLNTGSPCIDAGDNEAVPGGITIGLPDSFSYPALFPKIKTA